MDSSQPSPRLNPVFDLTSRVAAAAVALVGVTVLVGWAGNVQPLKA